MSFTDKQRRALRAKLRYQHVQTRTANGMPIAYVEGWHVIAEANRIFGYDGWDRKTLSPRCLWSESEGGQATCFYATKVCIVVRAGGAVIVREWIGTGFGRAATPEVAHEIALKAAETDATKRALATFGNPFGLALYDKDQAQVTKPRKPEITVQGRRVAGPPSARAKTAQAQTEDTQSSEPLVLHHSDGRAERFEDPQAFVTATLAVIPGLPTLDSIYAFWRTHRPSLTALRQRSSESEEDPVATILAALKERARVLGHARHNHEPANERRMAATALAIPKEKRRRNKEHLRYVARQPCVICGRAPSHAHHLRFAQPRALGLKVSDEYTVPLCSGHHDALHRTGDEPAWWARHGVIDPLKIAAKLWMTSRHVRGRDEDDEDLESDEDASDVTSGQATSTPTGAI